MRYEVRVGSKNPDFSKGLPDETVVVTADDELEAAFLAGQKNGRIGWTVKAIRSEADA